MKNQNLIIVVFLIAIFISACQKDDSFESTEKIAQVEAPTTPSQETLDALENIIESDFAEPQAELRCNDHHYGGIVRNNNLILAGTLCGVKLAFYGGSTSHASSSTWFYYHVDEKNTNGQYKRIDSGMKHGAWASWNYKVYSNQFNNSGCKWRAYVYAWDAPCGIWKRLAVKYY